MINLLPPEIKQDYAYARMNRRLLRWVSAFMLALLGLAIITCSGLLFMNDSIASYKTQIADSKAELTSQNITSVQKQVSSISSNLKLMVEVLSKEILFSKLLARLGSITPSNVILTNLSIDQSQSAVDIIAQTSNYNAATQLQINMADPANQIFSKADIESINCASGSQVPNPTYPCTATIRALFTNDNPFLFINSTTKASPKS